MKIIFLIIVFFHGLIHLPGFIKGFELKEVRGLILPVSKSMGLFWMAATVLFILYGTLFSANSKYAWFVGFMAVAISQTLIIIYWKDAKFGTIANFLILIVVFTSFGYNNFQRQIQNEKNQLLNQNEVVENKIIDENDIQNLPKPVKNWLRSSGMPGQPFIHIGKVTQKAEMKMKPEQDNWMNATAIQYTTIDNPAFIWSVDVKMNGIINFQGRDKFDAGKGEMLIKMNSLINVVNEKGEKLDEGALQRYLGEMVWFPSLALSPYITWEQINDNTAKATMTYKGTTGNGTFHFNENGDVTMFSALRYKDNVPEARRIDWIMNITDYKTFEKIKVPSKMTSTWKLDNGDWTWLKLEVTDLKYNKNVSN